MKRVYISQLLLAIILILSAVIRMVQIGVNPPSISWDEASIGYNAYTILTTGRDEHNTFLPLNTFAAFGDYKPPLPIYLTVPFVALFGLNEVAVRLPSVIFGTLTILVLYFLVLELLQAPGTSTQAPHKRQAPNTKGLKFLNFEIVWNLQCDAWNVPTLTALLSAAVLAVTPWHIMLSRAGFEANIALLFLVTGVWFVLKARTNHIYFYWCWLPFVLGIYTFNSTRYVGPLLAVALLILVRPAAISARKYFVKGILIACIALLPILPHLLSKEARLRFQEVSIFTDLRTVLTSNTRRSVDGFAWWSALLHNRRAGYAREYLIHFFDNVEPRFLFGKGDGNPKFSVQDTGQLLLVSAPFVVFGMLALFRDYPAVAGLLLWWLIAAIAPTAVARETPHALRVENGLPIYMIFTAYGLVMSIVAVKKIRFQVLLMLCYLLLFAGNFGYFWHALMEHYPKEFSGEWQYGYKQAIQIAVRLKNQYDTIVLTDSIGRPYIYALFYEKYPLRRFLETKDASFDAAGFYNVYGFDTYRFTKEGVGDYKGRTLYILPPKDVPTAARVIESIKLLNGTTILVAFE